MEETTISLSYVRQVLLKSLKVHLEPENLLLADILGQEILDLLACGWVKCVCAKYCLDSLFTYLI